MLPRLAERNKPRFTIVPNIQIGNQQGKLQLAKQHSQAELGNERRKCLINRPHPNPTWDRDYHATTKPYPRKTLGTGLQTQSLVRFR
jgi:hypothetical protein